MSDEDEQDWTLPPGITRMDLARAQKMAQAISEAVGRMPHREMASFGQELAALTEPIRVQMQQAFAGVSGAALQTARIHQMMRELGESPAFLAANDSLIEMGQQAAATIAASFDMTALVGSLNLSIKVAGDSLVLPTPSRTLTDVVAGRRPVGSLQIEEREIVEAEASELARVVAARLMLVFWVVGVGGAVAGWEASAVFFVLSGLLQAWDWLREAFPNLFDDEE